MNVLVTGAAGFIGFHVAQKLLALSLIHISEPTRLQV